MSLTLIDDRQVKNVAALTGIGSAAGATLDTIFPLISTILGNATGSATPSVFTIYYLIFSISSHVPTRIQRNNRTQIHRHGWHSVRSHFRSRFP